MLVRNAGEVAPRVGREVRGGFEPRILGPGEAGVADGEQRLVLLIPHVIHGGADVLTHMKLVDHDLRVRVRHVGADGVPIRLPQIHRNGRNPVALSVVK